MYHRSGQCNYNIIRYCVGTYFLVTVIFVTYDLHVISYKSSAGLPNVPHFVNVQLVLSKMEDKGSIF